MEVGGCGMIVVVGWGSIAFERWFVLDDVILGMLRAVNVERGRERKQSNCSHGCGDVVKDFIGWCARYLRWYEKRGGQWDEKIFN